MSDASFSSGPPSHDPFSQADPYKSPESYQMPQGGIIPGTRPTGLTVVCIVSIVLAVLVALTSASAAVMMPFQKAFAAMFAPPPPALPPGVKPTPQQEMAKLQSDMQAQIAIVSAKYFWVLMPLQIIQVVVAIWVVMAAVQTLSLSSAGRGSFVVALLAMIVLEVFFAVPHFMTQMEIQPIMGSMMEKMAESQPGPGGAMFGTIVKVSMIAGMVMAACLILSRVGWYAYAVSYLRREEIVKLCDK
jgi:hypothetical protein